MQEKSDIFSVHKNIYNYMKKKALSYEKELSPELKKYQKDQRRYAKRTFQISELDELLNSIEKSNIVYLGDFHTFDQSSRNLARLLRALTRKKTKFVIGVEFCHEDHQFIIDNYLNATIGEEEFLQSIEYRNSWRFPWNHYKIFFEIARGNNFEILALNSVGSLEERDQKAANIISDYITNYPETTLLVLFGELHIVPDKLPKEVNKRTQKPIIQTIVHQNLDEIYWKLEEKNKSNNIIKFNNFEFSLQTSAPWIKYDSMIYWYENLSDDPEFDMHEYIIEKRDKTLTSDIQENFIYLCQEIIKSMQLDISLSDLEDFNLYDHTKLHFVVKKLNSLPQKSLTSFYNRMVHRGKTFKIPFSNDYYCSNYSINRISYLVGLHIHNLVISNTNPDFEKAITSKKQKNKFLFFFYRCLIAYLSSKILNPFRKCYRYQDMNRMWQSPETPQNKKIYFKLALNIIDRNEKLDMLLKKQSLKTLYSSAKLVGFLVADNLYNKHFKSTSSQFIKLKSNIFHPQIDEKNFYSLLDILLPHNEYKNEKKSFF